MGGLGGDGGGLGSGGGAAGGVASGGGGGAAGGNAAGSGLTAGQAARLAAIKSAAATAIAKRESALSAAESVIQSTSYLGADQQILLSELQSAASGLTTLGTTIQADTTPATAAVDAARIFTQYRVFALLIPVAHLVRADDAALNVVVPDLNKVAALAKSVITPADQPLLTDLTSEVAKASADLSGLSGQLEGFTPAEWNANQRLFATDRAALSSACQALEQARQDAHKIVADLRIQANSAPTTAAPAGSTTTG